MIERKQLIIACALGVYRNRLTQKRRNKRKRLNTLLARLADCIAIGDDDEADNVRKAMKNVKTLIQRREKLIKEIEEIRTAIMEEYGINNEMTVTDEE